MGIFILIDTITVVKEFEYGVKELGFKGLKLHPVRESYSANDEILFFQTIEKFSVYGAQFIHNCVRKGETRNCLGFTRELDEAYQIRLGSKVGGVFKSKINKR